MDNIKNLAASNDKAEKVVKYAVIKLSISQNIDDEISDIKYIFASDQNNIFDSEGLAEQFCDHANNREKSSHQYQCIVQKIILNKKMRIKNNRYIIDN